MEVHSSMGWIILSMLGTILLARGQIVNQNVLSETIPIQLRQCYNSSYIVVKDNLLPMTTTNLIALLRKIEDSSYSMNSRLLAPAILLKYRYDGIQRIPDMQATQYAKPYSRSGKEYYLYKLQMNKIIPVSSSNAIPDDTLSVLETCTLHSMLSLSIDKYDRGDNDVPCSRLSKYSQWNTRFPRDLTKTGDAEYIWPSYDSHLSGDYQQYASGFPPAGSYQAALSQCPMENGVVYDKYGTLSPGIVIAGLAAGLNYQSVPYNSYFVQPRNGGRKVQSAVDHYRNLFATNQQPRNGNPNNRLHGQGVGYPQRPQDYDYNGGYGTGNGYGQGSGYPQGNGGNGYGAGNQGGYAPNTGSNGYGAGQGSNVGNGYGNTAGTYGNGANRYGNNGGSGYGNSNGNTGGLNNPYGTNSYGQVDIDGRYAATLAGAVALESLLQGPENLITIGGRGGWNSSSLPKYYFLQNWITDSVLTDARIMGGVDGLFLANNVQSWTSVSGDIKLSQILDAYYSDRGVFSSDVKACNRKNKFSQFSPQLYQQAYALSYMLNNDLPPGALIGSDGVSTFADYASTQTSSYISSLPSVSQCPLNASAPFAPPNADITIVIDCNWSFNHVAGIFNYLAEQCNFWKYGSNLTIISGKDGAVLAESVQSPLDIPRNYNQTVIGGFDFPKVLSQLKIRFQNRLQSSTITQSAGGLPHIVIFVPMTTSMSDSDKNNAQDTINYFRYNIPDVRFLYVVTGTKEMWSPFTNNPDKDIIVSPQGSDLVISLQPLVQRIATIPRRLINPNCGRYFSGGSYNQVSLDGYLSANEINYYRIHQNYFFRSGTNAVVTISSKSYNSPTLMVCQSRNNPLPSRNVTGSGNVNCQQLTSSNTVQLYLNDLCSSDYYAAACNPFFFSIYNTQTGSSANSYGASCKDPQCRFPDQIKYTISHTGFTCYSSASSIASSVLVVSILWILVTFRS